MMAIMDLRRSASVPGRGARWISALKAVSVLQATTLLLLAVATSIDSLGVGLSFALLATDFLIPALVIGSVSAIFSLAGVLLGDRLAKRFGEGVEILGGVILIGIGVQILIGHLSG